MINCSADIHESIINIDNLVFESEMNVIESLINVYEKQMVLLENYHGSEEVLELFNESFFMEAKGDFKTIATAWLKTIFKWIRISLSEYIDQMLAFSDTISKNRLIKRLENVNPDTIKNLYSGIGHDMLKSREILIDEAERFIDILKSFDFTKFDGDEFDKIEADYEKIKMNIYEGPIHDKQELIDLLKNVGDKKFLNKTKSLLKMADFNEKEFLKAAELTGFSETINSNTVSKIKDKAKMFVSSFTRCNKEIINTLRTAVQLADMGDVVNDAKNATEITKRVYQQNKNQKPSGNPEPNMA